MSENDGEDLFNESHRTSTDSSSGRDEVKEIQKMSRMETQLIQTWRGVLLFMLVITAAAVASITYALLTKEENAAYKATVRAVSNSSPFRSRNVSVVPYSPYSHHAAHFILVCKICANHWCPKHTT